MQVYTKIETLQRRLKFLRNKGKTIGFVPTMGALHDGHLTLVDMCQKDNDITVVSIFVNPTQFNSKTDLNKYPRPIRHDKDLLKHRDVDIAFLPSEKEMYPNGVGDLIDIDLKGLDEVLEGKHRPGHFQGVVQVVHRLLDIVKPDSLVMGQKDYQQVAIIQRMLDVFEMNITLSVVPTVREPSGLARSSRNERLTKEWRQKASVLHFALLKTKREYRSKDTSMLEHEGIALIEKESLSVEYFKVVDGNTLLPLNQSNAEDEDIKAVCLVAAWADDVRLIDNMILSS